ncbi:hypothetical protein Cob_v009923 [Colletotrichum orbiculare MAFF 240422]|uniref:Uncharacterized protein n=1 Tax=Colletotrichum orbiculare (strain 104-T / ATCC 96160 / CBS 514.97 / LARS 414 / MAFF 240422) TaxID=1213857 RepID=A0A484FFW2_COLOR|nr:hypothetical protein Cob_v009923 [Colletotrichum orbiculare MAFF 240422]
MLKPPAPDMDDMVTLMAVDIATRKARAESPRVQESRAELSLRRLCRTSEVATTLEAIRRDAVEAAKGTGPNNVWMKVAAFGKCPSFR